MDAASGLSGVQFTGLVALLTAILGGAFGLVTAFVNGWNARRIARDAVLREYRLDAARDVFVIARERIAGYFALQIGRGLPDHAALLKLLYPNGFEENKNLAFRMSSPFQIRNLVQIFHDADMALYTHLQAPDPRYMCRECEIRITLVNRMAVWLHDALEQFVFSGRTSPVLWHRLQLKIVKRRYDRFFRDAQISDVRSAKRYGRSIHSTREDFRKDGD